MSGPSNQLARIRVVDLETTGFDATDSIVEIGAVDLIGSDIVLVGAQLFRPPVPIPPQASAVHHITDEHVGTCPSVDEHLPRFLDHERSAGVQAFCAHNWKFEKQWLGELLGDRPAICTYKASLRAWPDAPSHTNQALRYRLKPHGLDGQIANVAHRALPDAYVTAVILRELLKKATVTQLIAWTEEPALLRRVSFGKHRGALWQDVPADYLRWIIEKSDQNEDVKFTAKFYLRKLHNTEQVHRHSSALPV